MRSLVMLTAVSMVGFFSASSAYAACTGTNGRGWGSGNGSGKFEMTTADKTCNISFPGFVDDVRKTRVPAGQVTITSTPKNGKVAVRAGSGMVYTPNPGFKGQDRFCTRNTSPQFKGQTLSGCVTVQVK